jgi:trans-2,3-dihydro-3-hydroxyanthranilate isomerase
VAPLLHIVDVFAERPYGGNPLAVVVTSCELPAGTMQGVAAEMNFSETTFVSPERSPDGGHSVRIFTPMREIAFAGHPILGTAWVLRDVLGQTSGSSTEGSVVLNLQVGQIPVTFESTAADSDKVPLKAETAWFRAPPAVLGDSCPRELMATALGIAPTDVLDTSPIQQVTSGASAMIVPLSGLSALRRCRLNLAAYAPLIERGLPSLVYLYCQETERPENDLSARFFFDAHGVREDPATGNGAAFLGHYILEHRVFRGDSMRLRIEQGREVRRPSLILLRALRGLAGAEVSVGGRVIPVVRGELV